MKTNSPQIENGYTRVANELLNALMKTYLSNYERRVIDCIIRYTYGFGRKKARLSLTFIGEATGIASPNIARSKKKLLEKNMIIQIDTGKLALQKNYKKWVVPKQAVSKQITKVIQIDNKKLSKQILKKENIKKTNKEIIPKKVLGGPVKKSFGNEDINFLTGYLKEKLGLPMLDGSVKQNRRYCHLAKNKFGGRDKMIMLIDVTAQDTFWATKITSFQQLFYKGVQIMSNLRGGKYADTAKI